MSASEHRDRRNAATPARIFSLSEAALVWRGEGENAPGGQVELTDIAQVRLSVEMAGQQSQVVCRVTDTQGDETVFGSMRWAGVGHWEPAADTFSALLRDLHLALLPYRDGIRFIEGSSMVFLFVMFGLGLALTGISLFFFALLFLVREQASGLFLIAGVVAGVWLTRLFWPRGPKPYDPETYARPATPREPEPADGV